MSPPQYKECVCGHLGNQHRDDKTCLKCDCQRFTRPSRRYAVETPGAVKEGAARRRRLGAGPKG